MFSFADTQIDTDGIGLVAQVSGLPADQKRLAIDALKWVGNASACDLHELQVMLDDFDNGDQNARDRIIDKFTGGDDL